MEKFKNKNERYWSQREREGERKEEGERESVLKFSSFAIILTFMSTKYVLY